MNRYLPLEDRCSCWFLGGELNVFSVTNRIGFGSCKKPSTRIKFMWWKNLCYWIREKILLGAFHLAHAIMWATFTRIAHPARRMVMWLLESMKFFIHFVLASEKSLVGAFFSGIILPNLAIDWWGHNHVKHQVWNCLVSSNTIIELLVPISRI
jgi:hypothetical protein